jgi:exodeoxyribonuclease-3
MKIATCNVNSIRARLPLVGDWLREVGPDILCLQETKVQDKDFPEGFFSEIGYFAEFHGQRTYNGVAILSRHPLESVIKSFAPDDHEARFISATIKGIPVMNVYVPQGYAVGSEKFSYKLRWLGSLLDMIDSCFDPNQPLIITGDFNIAMDSRDVFDPDKYRGDVGFHPDEQRLLKQLLDWGLVDVFRLHDQREGEFTFWDYRIPNGFKRNMGWRIDYILATRTLAEASRRIWIDKDARAAEKPSDHTFLAAEFAL